MFSVKFQDQFIFIYFKFVLLSHNGRDELSIKEKATSRDDQQFETWYNVHFFFVNLSAFTLFLAKLVGFSSVLSSF